MRIYFGIILFAISILFYYSCNCGCTQKACDCPELILWIQADVDNGKEGSFTKDELDGFSLIRTNQEFESIDTIKIPFGGVTNSDEYNTYAWIPEHFFLNFDSFKAYNFLISNPKLNFLDTISNISYIEKIEHTFCNKCKNCDDEYIECPHYYEMSLKYKGDTIDGLRFKIEK